MAKRKSLSKKVRFEVFKRDSFVCQYCGRSAPETVLHVDHIQPVSKEGSDDILNLITSCRECNTGKSNTLLSDDTAIARQKAQLDELNHRREQLELMLQWRKELKAIDGHALDAAVAAWDGVSGGFELTERGGDALKKLISKFGLAIVLDAIEDSGRYIKRDEDGNVTHESVETAFDKLGGICRLKTQPDEVKELFYIRGILRNRLFYCNDQIAIRYLKQAHALGCTVEQLKAYALEVKNWTEFREGMEQFFEESREAE